MAKLSISKFSCVDEAELELSKLTILIGPQASGKSVISKLVYFFNDIPRQQYRALEDGQSIEKFKRSLIDDFKKWFPPSAWGQHSFTITFQADPFFVKITRMSSKKSDDDEDIRLNLAPDFETEYEHFSKTISRALKRKEADEKELDFPEADLFWRTQMAFEKRREATWGDNFLRWQLFVPAGRSFFTSIGKAIAAFEYGGLDPLTLQFGRFFSSIRERRRGRIPSRRIDRATQQARDDMMRELFGGNIRFARENEYVEADDGRRVPFGLMSSGQQELLPLWLAVEFMQETSPRVMLYIEEPEAHLFPTAQSQLMEYLASILASETARNRMLITTHSPYVLSQLNILLKAGMMSEISPEVSSQVDKVVKRKNWIVPGSLAAYAIVGKRLKPIHDDSGLIDGEYLDEVSNYLSRELSALLEIEAKYAA